MKKMDEEILLGNWQRCGRFLTEKLPVVLELECYIYIVKSGWKLNT